MLYKSELFCLAKVEK